MFLCILIQIDEIKSQIKMNIYCIINVRRYISDWFQMFEVLIAVIFNSTPININGVVNIFKISQSRLLEAVMLRGDIYSISGFYHITNGNHRVINTQIKGGCHIIKPGVMGCHQGVINGLKSAL